MPEEASVIGGLRHEEPPAVDVDPACVEGDGGVEEHVGARSFGGATGLDHAPHP